MPSRRYGVCQADSARGVTVDLHHTRSMLMGGEVVGAAGTAGGVVPTPLDGRALVASPIGRGGARLKSRALARRGMERVP